MDNTGDTVSFDDVANILADMQRRRMLVALLEHDLRENAPVVIADSTSEADVGECLVAMQHIHLPKLMDYGFIDWNKETHEVVRGPKFDEIRPLLELLKDHDDELPGDWL